MTARPHRNRVRTALAAVCGIAAAAVTACAAASPAAASSPAGASSPATGQQQSLAPGRLPSVITCTRQAQFRPGRYTLACADGYAYRTGLDWAAWGTGSAFATGTDTFNVCIPTCPAGHLHSYPVLAVLWRAEPLPGHPSSATSPGSPSSTPGR